MKTKQAKQNKNTKKTHSVPTPAPKKQNIYLPAFICFIFAFLLYSNTIMHTYVMDDNSAVFKNWVVKKGVEGIPIILKTPYRYGVNFLSDNLYRPLSQIMFAIEWQLSPDNPHLSHFFNILFYALSCFLLFIVLRKYLSKVHSLIPFLITMLYAAHPIHTEVVANIKSRDEIMSFFFLMATLIFLHSWFTKNKIINLILAFLMFVFSIFSKEGVITMIFLFPIMGWYFTEAKFKSILTGSLILILPAICYILVRQTILSKYSTSSEIPIVDNFLIAAHDPVTHFATAIMLLGKYLLLIIIPYQQVSDYSFNQIPIVGLTDVYFIISFIVYVALGFYFIKNIKKRDPLVFGILFFLITLSLYSNILFNIGSSFAERFMFLPSLGFCIAFVLLISNWQDVAKIKEVKSKIGVLKSKPIFAGIFILLLLFFSIKTITRAAEWKNELKLFSSDINNSPNSARIQLNYGLALHDKATKGKSEYDDKLILEAITHFEKGAAIHPIYFECINQLGLCWKELKEPEKALEYYNKALQLYTKNPETWNNAGNIFYNYSKFDTSIYYYRQALKLDSTFALAYLNLGCSLFMLNKYDEVTYYFKKCIQFDPENFKAHRYIGYTCEIFKRDEEAKEWLEKANNLELKEKKKD